MGGNSRSYDSESECLFCHIESGRIRYENNRFVVMEDTYPVSPGHSLVIPKRHIASFFDLTDGEVAPLRDALQHARASIEAEQSPDGYNLGVNDGSAAGQTIMHLHLHVIPRYEGDQDEARGGIRWLFPDKAAYWW